MDNREALIEVALDYGEMLMITEHLDGEHLLYVYSFNFHGGDLGDEYQFNANCVYGKDGLDGSQDIKYGLLFHGY